MEIEDSVYASHPEVGLVLTGGNAWTNNQYVVQTQDGSRYVFSLLYLVIYIV
jgi:hypothetical protein